MSGLQSYSTYTQRIRGTGGISAGRMDVDLAAKLVLIALLVGTGGEATSAYIRQRGQKGYGFPAVSYASRCANPVECEQRPSAQILRDAKDTLRLSVTELAETLGVSRQTVYSWLGGAAIAPDNEMRVLALGELASSLTATDRSWTRLELRRVLPGGGTILDGVRIGRRPTDLVRELVQLLASEQAQREALATKLASRTKRPFDDAELGVLNIEDKR